MVMYKIPEPDNHLRDFYYAHFAPMVKRMFESFLNGTQSVPTIKIGKKHVCKTIVRVEQDYTKPSFSRDFLIKYSSDDQLRRLLCGTANDLELIFDEIRIDDVRHFQPLSKKKYSKTVFEGKLNLEVDDFNAIMKYIFVDCMFEAGGVFDKNEFIRNLNLRVCPYCGDTYIYESARTQDGKIMIVKPQLDHFLPKSKYPFFAMSFSNLIPSCPSCNLSPNKHIMDPKGEDKKHQYLMQPYLFDDSQFEFGYDYDGVGLLENDSYRVMIDYKNHDDIEKGMKEFMATDDRYRKHNPEVAEMWVALQRSVKTARQFLERFGIPVDFWEDEQVKIINFEFRSPNDWQKAMYKFKKDIFTKMLHDVKKHEGV